MRTCDSYLLNGLHKANSRQRAHRQVLYDRSSQWLRRSEFYVSALRQLEW